MESSMQNYALPGNSTQPPPGFPHSPSNWSHEDAKAVARAEGLLLADEHWQVIRTLQSYYARQDDNCVINIQQLHRLLDDRFRAIGGLKRLYELLPAGPVAQGCRLAGLTPPPGAVDLGFGSVV